jgi:DNA-binding FrmR family transcriptional regulator
MVADHQKIKHQIAIAEGQLEGVEKMIDSDEYCIDISNQLLAAIAVLKKANYEIINAHLSHCVRNAEGKEDIDKKLLEVSEVLKRMSDI